MFIKRLNTRDQNFESEFAVCMQRPHEETDEVFETVRQIISAVRQRGDEALLEYTNQFDRRDVVSARDLEITDFAAALEDIEPELVQALQFSADRIRSYHSHQIQQSWEYREPDGTLLGQQVRPLDRVGVYVPGGKAAYPSTVLMNVIPAKVAGVADIVMAVPAPDGHLAPVVLAAAAIAGVDRIFTIGGAQAVAALAYGTDCVPAVDKIVGPGNIYVAAAKSLVFGKVGIDMIAGPSEILIVCDAHSDPDWLAMDLFAQAEHDEQAQAILLCPDAVFLDAVSDSLKRLICDMPRAEIIRVSLSTRGALIEVRDLDEAIELVNRIAPEHLELSVEDPPALLPAIRHAGAIFLGSYSAEVLGDYCAGPNHVLPTAGTARFSSPLGVYDFQKRSSIIGCSAEGAAALSHAAEVLANAEGLAAHAASAAYRRNGEIQ